jgi:hypothetical protein
MSKGIKLLITISLLLNFLAIGLIAGYFFGKDQLKQSMQPPDKLHELTNISKNTEVHKLVKELDLIRRKGDKDHFKMKSISDDIYEILVAKNFDAELYDKKITEIHQLHQAHASETSESIKQLSLNLNQEERILLAEIMKSRPPGPPPR